MTDIISVTQETIQNQIYTIRGKQVMMDRDLAVLYNVETRVLNQAVKRNIERFPDDFMFELTKTEWQEVITNRDNLTHNAKFSPKSPFVFTEQGVAMLSAVLRSKTAIQVSKQVMRAFVEMRKLIADNKFVFQRLEALENNQSIINHKQLKAEENFERIFAALESPDAKPKQGVFYDGQVFDAHVFVSDLIKSARQSLVLIDNYVDETVLNLFTKRAAGVSFTIYTQKLTAQLALDLQKHNVQYDQVIIKEFKQSHDRFLILDGTVVYHIGASLKDLGKKWFAFSKMEMNASEILKRLI